MVTQPNGKLPLIRPTTLLLYESDTYSFVHFILQIRLGAEDLVGTRRAKGLYDLSQQEEIIEQKTIQLLVALGFVEFPAVQKFAWSQAVGN